MGLFLCDLLVSLSPTKLPLLSGLETVVWMQPVALVVRIVGEGQARINKRRRTTTNGRRGLVILMQQPLSVLFLFVFVDRTAFVVVVIVVVVVVKTPLVPTRFRGPLSGSGKT